MAINQLCAFVKHCALPMWATSGFDHGARCFHERLDFSHRPIAGVPRRLMVQARQIVVYARATLIEWYPDGGQIALQAFETLLRQYPASDGKPGWCFSLNADASVADSTRDLYTHAFILYMLAWMYRLTRDPAILATADKTLFELDRIFGSEDRPGFLSKVPGRTDLREQNPHMHLLEALLSLADFSEAERYLARAGRLVEQFDQSLITNKGIVLETFDPNWQPIHPPGTNLFEPGHQMEWAWLLREYQRLSHRSVDDRVNRLMEAAIESGIDRDTGLVRSLVSEAGKSVSNASRTWPHTEAIRALCREDPDGTVWPGLVSAIAKRLSTTHLPVHLGGGWIDQLDDAGAAAIDFMPASTLYHLAGAAMDCQAICHTSTGQI